MLKKNKSLGTAISRNEAKMIVGGNYTELMVDLGDGHGDGGCTNWTSACTLDEDCAAGCKCVPCEGCNSSKVCGSIF